MGVERSAFWLLNQGSANRLYDAVLPVLTDDQVNLFVLAAVGLLLLLLGALSGGRRGLLWAGRVVLTAALAVGLGELIAAHGLKEWVGRPRPPRVLNADAVRLLVGLGSHASFPSSHAVNTFAVMTAVALGYPRWRCWALGYAALIAYSRVYVGVHWPSDVLFGMVLGMVLAFLVWRAGDRVRAKRETERG